MFDLSGKVALVTGASSGIGKDCAIALAHQGAKVAIAARRKEKLDQLAVELVAQKCEVKPLQMDVTKLEQVESGIAQIVKDWGRLDILVNNAGVYRQTPLASLAESDWDTVLDTNLKAYAFVAKLAAVEMKKNKWGRIVNIGSVAMGNQGFGISAGSAYAASKGGVVGLTESLALELAPDGILVNCIAPGLIESEMTQSFLKDEKLLQGFLAQIPVKRPGKGAEIASGVVFFASDEASYITGAVLVIDGGWLAG